MKLLESVPFSSPWRPFALWSPSVHVAGAVAVCAAWAMAAYGLGWLERSKLQRVQDQVTALERTMALPGVPVEQVAAQPAIDWPLRQSVDEVVQQASELAARAGVSIRSLSVSHQAPSPAAWGRVNLEVSAGGSYAALKGWQSDVSARFPSLAVQNMRMQAAAAGNPAGLDSQWTWVLHVRD